LPIYEYKCKDCGNEFEMLQKFSDPPPSGCPSCSGGITKLISQSSFHLKGTGWYATDYGKKSGNIEKKEKASESVTKKSDDSAGSSSKETKDSKGSED